MPGPTIIARKNQLLRVKVYNELPNSEGISIHWHGIHQKSSYEMDGVSFITQNRIDAFQSFTYKFRTTPSGTHWYHAHSGAQRTDGLFEALIVKDAYPNNVMILKHILFFSWIYKKKYLLIYFITFEVVLNSLQINISVHLAQ